MNIITEFASDIKTIIAHRKRLMPIHKRRNRHAPKAGDVAPDFTLYDTTGTESITLSDLRGKKPVALVFGSYT